MSKYDLIAFDMDGTLLNSKKEIPEETVAAIKKAVGLGKIVCISTGRSIPEIAVYGDRLNDVQYFIAVSGSVIYDNRQKKVLQSAEIGGDDVKALFDAVKEKDVMIHVHSDRSIVEKSKLAAIEKYNMGIYRATFEKIAVTPENLRQFYDEEKFPVYKLNFYLKTLEEREPLRRKILSLGIGVSLTDSEVTSLECTPEGISKGSGLKDLCRILNIPVEKTIAVGDGDNDFEILEESGLAVAMGNANVRLKNAADIVVADNDSGGCVQAIEEYLLG